MAEIDFVITWVDGSDPELAHARKQAKERAIGKAKGNYHNNDEIYYLIASIIRYAPFARRVHIVTDNQNPLLLQDFITAGLCGPDFLQVVSHDVIFSGLQPKRPTFNSLVIEAALWRIPGLAEQFVYCNDDMFLNAPFEELDFFQGGRPVVGGTTKLPGGWRPRALGRNVSAFLRGNAPPDSPTYNRAQEQGAKLAGVDGRFLSVDHHPHPLRRSTFEAFHAEKPDLLHAQLQHQFRHSSQYLPVSLSNHLERRRHGVEFTKKRPVAYIEPGTSAAKLERSLNAIRDAKVPFGCIQCLQRFPPLTKARIHATLREKFSRQLPPSVLSAA